MRSLAVDLSPMDTPLLKERATTENVSSHGIRVATEHEWKPGDSALVISYAGRRLVPSGGRLL